MISRMMLLVAIVILMRMQYAKQGYGGNYSYRVDISTIFTVSIIILQVTFAKKKSAGGVGPAVGVGARMLRGMCVLAPGRRARESHAPLAKTWEK